MHDPVQYSVEFDPVLLCRFPATGGAAPGMFRHRQLVPEIMDQPGLAPDRHHAALRGLSRINLLSGTARVLWPPLRELARETAPRSARVLDLATGGGDVPLRLWRKASGCCIWKLGTGWRRQW